MESNYSQIYSEVTMSKDSKQKPAQQSDFARRQRQALIRNAAIGVIIVLAVGGLIFYVADQTAKGERDKIRPDANAAEQTIADEGAGHAATGAALTFKHYPPSSGNHYDTPAQAGFYEEPVAEGYWLHSMEHGNVVVLYNCQDGCTEMKAQLKTLISKAPTRRCPTPKLLVMPYSTGMTTPITVLAWGKQLDLPGYDEEAILNFYKRYEDRGPELTGCE